MFLSFQVSFHLCARFVDILVVQIIHTHPVAGLTLPPVYAPVTVFLPAVQGDGESLFTRLVGLWTKR